MANSYLQQQLDDVRRDVLEAGRRAEMAVAQAVDALAVGNAEWAEAIVAAASVPHEMCETAQQRTTCLIATQRPTAGDLQAALATLLVAEEVDRMAEHAAGIAAVVANRSTPLDLAYLPVLTDRVLAMLDDALNAYADGRASTAQRVVGAVEEVESYARAVRRLESAWTQDEDAEAVLTVAHLLGLVAGCAARIARRTLAGLCGSGEMTRRAA